MTEQHKPGNNSGKVKANMKPSKSMVRDNFNQNCNQLMTNWNQTPGNIKWAMNMLADFTVVPLNKTSMHH